MRTAPDPTRSEERRAAPSETDWRELFAARTERGGSGLTAILALAGATGTITFSGGFPAAEALPLETLRELMDEILSDCPALALGYSPTEGFYPVRQALADFVAESQGQVPAADDVLVTSGGIEGLQLVCKVLLEVGDVVAVEAPSYLGALMSFSGFEADLHALSTDDDGLHPEQLDDLVRKGSRPKLVYVIPDHQNPTGRSMSAGRRQALVESCRRHKILVVEDVAYRELGFTGSAAPSLWSLAPDVVCQLGTFSKILFPGMRLGWALGPGELVHAMAAAKQSSDQCAGALGQVVMERFVSGGHLGRHLPAVRRIYARRAAAMHEALESEMPPDVSWTKPEGGFFVWLTAPAGLDTVELAPLALEAGVAFVPGAPFYVDGSGRDKMRLAYSGVSEEAITEGVSRLGGLLSRELRQSA